MPKAQTKDASAVTRSRRDSRGDERRRRIFKSLHDCIIRKGYVKTSLADIADGAGMSPSHLLYYFNGKEDILEQYFATVRPMHEAFVVPSRAHAELVLQGTEPVSDSVQRILTLIGVASDHATSS